MCELCDYSGLFNTLHIVFLFVLYIGAIKYIKDSIILREFLVSNKYSVAGDISLRFLDDFYVLT